MKNTKHYSKVFLFLFVFVAIFSIFNVTSVKAAYPTDDYTPPNYYYPPDYPPNYTYPTTPQNINVTVQQPDQPTKGETGIMDSIKNLGDGLKSIPKDIADAITNAIFKPIADAFSSDISKQVSSVNNYMVVFKDMLTKEDLNSGTFGFSKSLWGALKPVGYSSLTLFFLISFCKKTIYFEMMNELEIYKSIIKLIFTKSMVDYSYTLLAVIVNVNKGIVNIVFNTMASANNSEVVKWINTNTNISAVQTVFNFLKSFAFLTFIGICLVICTVMVVIRQIEIAVLSALAPIFFSTFAGESTSDVFKAYIKNFVSVVAQTVWIAVGLAFLMNSYISSINVNQTGLLEGGNFLVGIVALTVYCIQAPSSVKSAIGGSGGGGLSLSSLVTMSRGF